MMMSHKRDESEAAQERTVSATKQSQSEATRGATTVTAATVLSGEAKPQKKTSKKKNLKKIKIYINHL